MLTWLFPAGMESAFDTDVAGGQLDEARVYAALADSPVRSPELLRFATHLLLFLRELLPDGGGLQPDGPLDKHLNAVVGNFVLHLSDAKRYAWCRGTPGTFARRSSSRCTRASSRSWRPCRPS